MAVTETPCPIGTLPIVDPDQYDGSRPGLSPGKSMRVGRPKPKRAIHLFRPASPRYRAAMVIAPTFDDRWRIWATVIRSVGRISASWITRSATWSEYGRVK